jgi:pimeloyl-ACP methyl ester carboxylesterase
MRRRRWILAVLFALVVVSCVAPLLVPVPPLEDTVPPRALADADSRFVEIGDLDVHFKEAGSGSTALLLLHGFGASVFTWREVMTPLAARYRVVAYDRPAFGLTERPLAWQGVNPYSGAAQVSLARALLDRLGIERAVLIGNSAGGRVAVDFALAAPERVAALVLVSPAVGMGGGAFRWLTPVLNTPQLDHLGPLLVRGIQRSGPGIIERAWHRPELVTEEVMAGYRKPLRAEHWDRALFELTRAPRGEDPGAHLGELARTPTLVVTGDDDRIVPTANSIDLAAKIPDARLEVLAACGHVPQEECPQAFLDVVVPFIDSLGGAR